MKFKNIYINSEKRLEDCLLSLWAKGQHPMRNAIQNLFNREPFIAEPVFQSMFPWEHINTNTNWRSSFEPDVAKAIEKYGTKGGKRSWSPYKHQNECWDLLNKSGKGNAESVIVTSGTGSGKTECFLYPVLNDLYKHKGDGVQALFMYPLNALAADQKERIRWFCKELGLTFACYNGNLPPKATADAVPVEMHSRTEVRHQRPDILMSNPSMLEYIMVRDADRSILQPNGTATNTLRWIIIDEAHTYTGSSAVELRYELDRVINAFGADRKDIHFACTSATIGANPSQLVDFIEKLTGQDKRRLHVISGNRNIPKWTISEISGELGRLGLKYAPVDILHLQKELDANVCLSCQDIWKILHPGKPWSSSVCIPETLEDVDNLCGISKKSPSTGLDVFLLMARAHFFMREPNGLFACANPACPQHGNSPMGFITSMDGKTCPHCGAPLLELVQCRTCGEYMYTAKIDANTNEVSIYRDKTFDDIDNIFADEDTETAAVAPVSGNVQTIKAGLSASACNAPYLASFKFGMSFGGGKLKKDSTVSYIVSMQNPSTHTECCSGCGHNASSNNISSFRLSTNTLKQVITPALLAESTPNTGQPWGKYISFTDSRSKTAISAKQFNISAEREHSMGKILHFLSGEHITSGVIKEYPLCAFPPHIISNDLFEHLASDSTSSKEKASYMAAVMRLAIGRRLLRGTGSLESLGLVSVVYPTLSNAYVPSKIQNDALKRGIAIGDTDWRNFLKICLDYCVRTGNCIQPLDRNGVELEKNYIRDNNPTVIFKQRASFGKTWPSISEENGIANTIQDRIVLLLCAALGINSSSELDIPANHQLVESILDEAWKTLTDSSFNLLKSNPQKTDPKTNAAGYYLDLSADNPWIQTSSAKLKLNCSSFICPVTDAFLDVTFLNVSPMITGRLEKENLDMYRCSGQPISMPLLPTTSHPRIENWLASDPNVCQLKQMGLWSNYFENVFLNHDVYVAAEHSAQLGRTKLEEFTRQFMGEIPGVLNILNCSTTMEMGVDIGDIDLVVLSNVPPAASNYLQRAGRAGRFGQSQAAVLTSCSGSSLGMEAFGNPVSLLVDRTTKQMPRESSTIIQRHINSFFFSDFVNNNGISMSGATTVEDFFCDCPLTPGKSVCDSFVNHLNAIPASKQNDFSKIFPPQYVFNASRNETVLRITNICKNFNAIYADLVNAISATSPGSKQETAAKAQLLRFADQELLNYLSEMQFFPNASMPTGIVEFDASTKEAREQKDALRLGIKALKSQKHNATPAQALSIENDIADKRRKLSKLEEQTAVSREAIVALSEYAPQQTVVVDEQNYVSFALAERSQYGIKSKQKYIQRCDCCGYTTYSDTYPGSGPIVCPKCGAGTMGSLLSDGLDYTMARLAVGFRADYHSNDNRQEKNIKRFYNINALLPEFSWSNAVRIGIADVNGDIEGTIIYINKGDGHGFAICTNNPNGHFCGKAVVDVELNKKPSDFNHAGCTTTWSKKGGAYASGNVQRHVVLSCEDKTSFAAINFFSNHKCEPKQIYSSRSFLYSAGIVLKNALCNYLAIDETEIGFDVNRIGTHNFLFIYDTNKGGSGYSFYLTYPQVFQKICEIALDTIEHFSCNCKDSPGHACTKCIVSRNSYAYSDILSLAEVYEWLKKQKKMFRTVPSVIDSYSPGCIYDQREAIEILKDSVERKDVTDITFYIPKECSLIADDWNDATCEMKGIIQRAQLSGKKVHIILDKDNSLSDPIDIFALHKNVDKLKFMDSVNAASFTGPVRSLLLIEGSAGPEHYFTTDFDKLPLSRQWGEGCSEIFFDRNIPNYKLDSLPSDQDVQDAFANGKIIIRDGLIPNGHYLTDSIFMNIIVPNVINDPGIMSIVKKILNGQHVKIEFCENYLVSPLACHMLVGLISEIKNLYGVSIDSISLMLDNCLCDNVYVNAYSYIKKKFKDNTDRDSYICDLFQDEFGIVPTIGVNVSDHFRWLRLTDPSGNIIEIRPDHGIGGGWQSTLKYGDLPYLNGSPVNFTKNYIAGKPEESILYYFKITRV